MSAILEWLLGTVIALPFGLATSPAELIGFVTNGAAVYLVAKNNIWTFPVGILGAAFFFILFIDARLYTDAWLQVFFLVIQVIGWGLWLKAGPNRTPLKVAHAPKWVLAVAGVGIAAFVFLMIPVLREAHGAFPAADSSSTGLSVAAQTIMSFRLIEHWYLWIVADLIYIPLYFAKGLAFTSLLYVVFLGLCVKGLLYWRKVYAEQKTETLPQEELYHERVPSGPVMFMTVKDET